MRDEKGIYTLPPNTLRDCSAGARFTAQWFNRVFNDIYITTYTSLTRQNPRMINNLNCGYNKVICNPSVAPSAGNALLGKDLPTTLTNLTDDMMLEIDDRYAEKL